MSQEYSDDDPLAEPKNTQHIDLSKLSPQELKIYKLYGKLPTTQQILASKFHDKKYFDSGDYAMQKQKQKLQGNKGSNGDSASGNNNGGIDGVLGGTGSVPFIHPNAEKVREMSVRNSISATNAQIFANGKSGLLNESTPRSVEQSAAEDTENDQGQDELGKE